MKEVKLNYLFRFELKNDQPGVPKQFPEEENDNDEKTIKEPEREPERESEEVEK